MERHKTRFAPSPTGHLHVGGARTALFNWVIARQSGGTFLLRMEDTDRARHDESAVEKIQEDLRWLGLDWDEGIGAGGENGPYRQSERLDLYREAIERLLAAGRAYHAFETPEELEAMRERARARTGGFRYPRPSELPSAEDVERARAEERPVTVRFLCPGHDVTVVDEIFGRVTVPRDTLDDFVIQKADGYPTFYLANVVDDALMGVDYVCRGQEFLDQTWRQSALREALGHPEPRYLHMPLTLDMKGRKLSKRDGDVDVFSFRRAGYLPEALVNFIALLGWRPGGDREKFTIEELVAQFDPRRVSRANSKFDREKLLSFNTDALAEASPERLLAGLKDWIALNDTHLPASDDGLLRRLLEACRGIRTFADVARKCDVLFAPDDTVELETKAVKKVLEKNDGAGWAVLEALRQTLAACDWSREGLEATLEAFCRERGLGLGKVAQPLRVALTGSTVSPSIHDTLLFAGREHALARIERCLTSRSAS